MPGRPYDTEKQRKYPGKRERCWIFLIPIISLIICCMVGMFYTGFLFRREFCDSVLPRATRPGDYDGKLFSDF